MEPMQTITHFQAQISSDFVAVVGVKVKDSIKKVMVWKGFEPTAPRVGGRPADHYTRLAALLELGEVLV